MTSRVNFFLVKENSAKLNLIQRSATHYFGLGIPLLFLVPNEESASYVDDFLWKFPPEGFLPHSILKKPSKDLIGITTIHENFNQAKVLFNLCPDFSPLSKSISLIFDFMDETHPLKHQQSLQRKEKYLEEGFKVD